MKKEATKEFIQFAEERQVDPLFTKHKQHQRDSYLNGVTKVIYIGSAINHLTTSNTRSRNMGQLADLGVIQIAVEKSGP